MFGHRPFSSAPLSGLEEAQIFEHVATGGLTLAGGAAYSEGDTYAGSGGLLLGGEATTSYVPNRAQPRADGRGASFQARNLHRTINRYGPREYIYVGQGGLALGGAAYTAFKSAAVTRTASLPGVKLRPFTGKARSVFIRSSDAVFLLLAA